MTDGAGCCCVLDITHVVTYEEDNLTLGGSPGLVVMGETHVRNVLSSNLTTLT